MITSACVQVARGVRGDLHLLAGVTWSGGTDACLILYVVVIEPIDHIYIAPSDSAPQRTYAHALKHIYVHDVKLQATLVMAWGVTLNSFVHSINNDYFLRSGV
jgi:hypothetical protein